MNFTFIYKLATRLQCTYQALVGISTLGAHAIILNEQNQILLVKHTYKPHWYIPGGGVKKGESIKSALLRELKEEVGLTVLEEPKLFGIYHHYYLKVNDYPCVYIIRKFTLSECYSKEIAEKQWYDFSQLPQTISPGTKRRLIEYFNRQPPSAQW